MQTEIHNQNSASDSNADHVMQAVLSKALDGLASQGYVKLENIYSVNEMSSALEEVKKLDEHFSKKTIPNLPNLDKGQQVVYNLQNKSSALLKLILDKKIITELLCQCLNDQWHKAIPLDQPNYILRSYQARNNVSATPMHIDSYIPYQGEHALSIQVSIILETQNRQNGCTLLVPGSHQSGRYVQQENRNEALAVESNVGDVVVWDSRIWHGTAENTSGESRWSLIATFVRWWIKQGYQITESIPDTIYQTLNDSQKAVLGFCSRPYKDEFEGIDFKTGFDSLPKKL